MSKNKIEAFLLSAVLLFVAFSPASAQNFKTPTGLLHTVSSDYSATQTLSPSSKSKRLNNGCLGELMPDGRPNQTIRCDEFLGWVATSNLLNNGFNIGLGLNPPGALDTSARLYVDGSGLGNVFTIKADNPNDNSTGLLSTVTGSSSVAIVGRAVGIPNSNTSSQTAIIAEASGRAVALRVLSNNYGAEENWPTLGIEQRVSPGGSSLDVHNFFQSRVGIGGPNFSRQQGLYVIAPELGPGHGTTTAVYASGSSGVGDEQHVGFKAQLSKGSAFYGVVSEGTGLELYVDRGIGIQQKGVQAKNFLDGQLYLTRFAGQGNAYACFSPSGELFRSQNPCTP